mgnify:CR=1 FL=1
MNTKTFATLNFFLVFIFFTYFFGSPKEIPSHVDEPNIVEKAIKISEGSLNPEFFRYPSGHMNVLAIIFKIFSYFKEEMVKEDYYSIAWLFSRVLMTLIITMISLICSINLNYYYGFIGTIISILCPVLYTHANFAIVDVSMTFFVTLFFLVLTKLYYQSDLNFKNIILIGFIIGIAVSMKYTAALLIPVLIFISTGYIQKNRSFILSEKGKKIVLLVFGFFLLVLGAMAKINQEAILVYFIGLTTDGIIEIEYIRTFKNLNLLIIFFGILLIIVGLVKKFLENKLIDILISPFHIYTIFVVIISFALFSPYTIIEYKKSFSDFMYEYRHMKIGSAAQYHHSSDEYRYLVSNLSFTRSIKFYVELFCLNFGVIGLFIGLYGAFIIYLRNRNYSIAIFIYFFLMLFILFTWKNFAIRYSLTILPILIIFIIYGLYDIQTRVSRKLYFDKILVTVLIYLIMFIQPVFHFILFLK